MEFMTTAVLSGLIYDMLKNQVSLTADNFKDKLLGWLVDDSIAKSVEAEIAKLQLSDEMSESLIIKKVSTLEGLQELMLAIKPESSITINQVHNGAGDNVAGNKNINN